jgi:5-methylcytosine-specific restriction endonuclease McrA
MGERKMSDHNEDYFFPIPKPAAKKKKAKNIPKQIRAYVKERDHHQCVVCGAKKSLQLHHLITKGRYDPKLYNLEHVHDPRNLATVCASCHRKIHDNPEMMEYMLHWQKIKFGHVRKEF